VTPIPSQPLCRCGAFLAIVGTPDGVWGSCTECGFFAAWPEDEMNDELWPDGYHEPLDDVEDYDMIGGEAGWADDPFEMDEDDLPDFEDFEDEDDVFDDFDDLVCDFGGDDE
jgi:hypothetical protein